MKYLAQTALLLAIIFPGTAQAETVLRIGDDIGVSAEQVVEGDYYVSVGPFGKTSMSGSVAQDMYAFGGSVTVNGSIGEDLTVIAGTSQLHATVTDDVRIISGDVTLGEHVGGDLFVIAGSLTVLSSATIDGDLFFFGGEATINGKVAGSIMGTSEKIRINATVGKNVDIKTALAPTLGEDAQISGAVTYESPAKIVRAQNAVVEGEVTQKAYTSTTPKKDIEDAAIPFFMALFASLTFFLLFRKELGSLVQLAYLKPLQSSLFGFALIILGPLVAVLLMVTILGMFVGVSLLAFSILVFIAGYVLSGVVVGAWLSKLFTKKLQVSLLWVIIGTAVVHGALYIPVVGVVVVLCSWVLATGGIAYSLYKSVS